MHFHCRVLESQKSGVPIVEPISNGLITYDPMHAHIHAGNAYMVTDNDTDVDIAGPKYYSFVTPAATVGVVHFDFTVWASGGALVEIFADPTINAAGNAETAVNRNFGSTRTAGSAVKSDCTTQAPNNDGTLKGSWRVDSSSGFLVQASGDKASRHELVLAPATTYIIKITVDGDNTETHINLDWYEVQAEDYDHV